MKKLIEHINKEFNDGIKIPFDLSLDTKHIKINEFTEKYVNSFLNKKVLININEKYILGVLKPVRGKYGIFENENELKSFSVNEIKEIQHNNTNVSLQEVVTKEDDGFHVRSKKGKNLGGPYKSKKQATKRLKQVEYFKHVKEDFSLLLREKLKDRFFKLSEEIVNKDNKGKLTSDRQASRDKIEKKLGDVKVVKGPPGRMDTPEEARFRLATFIELNGKKGGKKKKDK
jgi:hypothetical protein